MDDKKTLVRIKESLKAPFSFVPDPDGKVVKAYDVKVPVVSFAQRYTFVVGAGRKILEISTGSDAIDVSAAIESCPIRRPAEHG